MITLEDWVTIRNLQAKGHGKKTIAKILGISKNTVKAALQKDSPPAYQRNVNFDNKLIAPYAESINEMYLEKELIGTRIFTEITQKGYQGSMTTLYRYLKSLGKEMDARVTARFETEPGEQGQYDWSPYWVDMGGKRVKVVCFLLVLGYSRYRYMTFSFYQDKSSVLEALEESLRHLGGSPREVLIDNAKSMVLEHLKNDVIRFNPDFLELAGAFRFNPRACQLFWARTKGKVERPFYYIEQHFIKGNTFHSIEDLIRRGQRFIQDWNQKEHTTTREKPVDRYEQEKGLLSTLPEYRYYQSIRELRKVSWDCLVSYQGSRYSVHHAYAGQRVWVATSHGYLLNSYSQKGDLLYSHTLSQEKGKTIMIKEHYQGIRNSTPKTAPRIREVFEKTFAAGKAFYEKLVTETSLNAAYHASIILGLREYYADEAIDGALQKASSYQAYSYQAVKGILKSLPLKEVRPAIHAFSIPHPPVEVRSLSYYTKLLTGEG